MEAISFLVQFRRGASAATASKKMRLAASPLSSWQMLLTGGWEEEEVVEEEAGGGGGGRKGGGIGRSTSVLFMRFEACTWRGMPCRAVHRQSRPAAWKERIAMDRWCEEKKR